RQLKPFAELCFHGRQRFWSAGLHHRLYRSRAGERVVMRPGRVDVPDEAASQLNPTHVPRVRHSPVRSDKSFAAKRNDTFRYDRPNLDWTVRTVFCRVTIGNLAAGTLTKRIH